MSALLAAAALNAGIAILMTWQGDPWFALPGAFVCGLCVATAFWTREEA
jgi:hypothetical protein